ncbi:Retrovirus-related Pol polyprotein from transposon 17.6 [Vitis vinifera]|uniref:Retrovirus-related Pol polyprotein from transposon 17.6 n=1 Tax=Vitis vinifera TaxID=29760 RepID=A0A438IJ84_VITVI|nr:Retrovirus-related Pol polyprotein from transposon 17.6 [Vitis vinifera]
MEGKASKKPGWKKQGKKPATGGKPMEKTTKFVQQTTQMVGCFICNGPHRAKDCPKREKLSALVSADDKGDSDSETAPRVSPLQLLNALVDSGATHNFVATREATRLGLKLEEDTSRIKAVNSKAQKIQGIAKNVLMQIDFLLRAKVALIPHLGGLVVLKEKQPCFVKALRMKDGGKGQPEMLSAIQLKKGLKKGQETYVVPLIEIKEGQSMEVPDSVVKILKEFKDVMPAELLKELPPRRPIDHKIELLLGTKASVQAPYRMPPAELLELRKQLKELLDAGLIQPSKAPYGTPVLFQKKQDGSLHMCVDYRALNKVAIKNKYPIPLATELFDRLSKTSYFTKLDLRSGYWQVRIAAEDEGKTTCVTRYGSYEFLVMPFGLTNALATFCNLMNDVLFDYLDAFVVVYLDDIPEKCEFAQEEITFLGHKISASLIRMDKGKVQAIMEWTVPTKVTKLRSFLGLANYYKRFIKGYSKRVSPLTNLLKKDKPWDWSMQCQMAFEGLKEAISIEPVLRLLDLDLPFEVQMDASDRALGGVLVQEGHPVAYESRKLNNAEQSIFTVVTDNVANTFFKTQKKLSPRQARWQEFLADFKFEWLHRPGRHNTVADALCRKEVIAYITALSEVISDFNEKIKLAAEQDAVYGRLKQQMDKTKRKKAAGLLQPLPIPERPWENTSMDFITGFPKVRDFKSVFVVVDRFSKYAVFIPALDACPAEEAAKLFFSNVVKHFGLPKDIVNDRDARFTGRFWVELFRLLGSELKFSTANHPQTDGSSVTGMSPFELAIGVQPRMPLEVAKQKTGGSSPAAYKLAQSRQEMFDEAWTVGDRVLLKLTPQIWKKISSKTRQMGLIPKYDGPFEPYHEDLDAERVQTKRAPPLVMK